MSEEHKKSNNFFLTKQKNDKPKNDKPNTNIFANEIGKQVKDEPKREININDDELFPSLTSDIIIKKNKKQNTISYASIAKKENIHKKEVTSDVDSGWVHLFRENGKTHFLYGQTTPACLEIERKYNEYKIKKERDELNLFFRELEEERNLRKELYGDIIDFYDPKKDRFYTKEENIVIYGLDDLSDSDTDSAQEFGDCDYDNVKHFDNDR
jgi:hypothetical protein